MDSESFSQKLIFTKLRHKARNITKNFLDGYLNKLTKYNSKTGKKTVLEVVGGIHPGSHNIFSKIQMKGTLQIIEISPLIRNICPFIGISR